VKPSLIAQMTTDRLDRFARAWLCCDLDGLRDHLTEDVVYSPLSGELVRGRDAVVRRFAAVMAQDEMCELSFEPSRVSGTLGTCRWRMSGRTADGAAFTIEGIDLYEFEGDRIRSKDVYQKACAAIRGVDPEVRR
jgi:ketosteroid isomerase-like protein